MSYDQPMDIFSKPGTKVVFSFPENGWPHDKESNAKHLVFGKTYTVAKTDPGSCHTDVFLVEVPGIRFNSVNFRELCTEE
jgi:hypothetical protein